MRIRLVAALTPNVGCVALKFDETWRLKDVRIFRSKKTIEPAASTIG